MYFKNFLSSGHIFEEAEENLAFRFQFINALILVSIVANLMFILLDQFGINKLVEPHLFISKFYSVVSCLTVWYLRRSKRAYMTSAWIMIIGTFVTFTSALIYQLNDELRIVWFYILVAAAYALLGNKGSLATTVAVIAAVAIAKFNLHVTISDNAFTTFVISLCVTSGISYAYTNLANSYFARIAYSLTQLRDLATKDPLTGIWNSRAFYDMSNKLIQLEQRNASPYCTLFIDLDHFKSINDQYGHDMGDTVLRAVSDCIVLNIRNSDIVGRIGGEEFAVFLPGTDSQGARQLAEKLRHGAESLMHAFPGNAQRAVTLSIGVAQGEITDHSISDIQKRADIAMYEAKKQGRNRVAMLAPAV